MKWDNVALRVKQEREAASDTIYGASASFPFPLSRLTARYQGQAALCVSLSPDPRQGARQHVHRGLREQGRLGGSVGEAVTCLIH